MRILHHSYEKREIPKIKDMPINSLITEMYNQYSQIGVNMANAKSFEQVYIPENHWKSYTDRILKGITNESDRESIRTLLNNTREMLIKSVDGNWLGFEGTSTSPYVDMESAVSANIHINSFLNGPVIRGVWSRSFVPLLFKVKPLTVPSFAVTMDVPYLEKDGIKYYLPKALIDEDHRDLFGLTPLIPSPSAGPQYDANGNIIFNHVAGSNGATVEGNIILDSLPGTTLASKRRVDVNICVRSVIVTGVDSLTAGGQEVEITTPTTKNIVIRAGRAPNTKSQIFTMKKLIDIPSNVPGYKVTAMLDVTIDLSTGQYWATTTSKYIKGFKLDAKLSSEDNKSALTFANEQSSFTIDVGNGIHVHLDTPIELLQDFSKFHQGADYIISMTDLISETYSGILNREAMWYLDDSFKKEAPDFIPDIVLKSANIQTAYTFRVGVAGDPGTYNNVMLKKCISFAANRVKQTTRIEDGFWSIVGSANNVTAIADFQYQTFDSFDPNSPEADTPVNNGFRVGYTWGFITNTAGTGKFRCLFSYEFEDDDGLIAWFNSTDESRPTHMYYPYSYTVTRGGYQNPNNVTVPSLMITKRHKFEDFLPAQVRIDIIGNDETQFTDPKILK